MKFPNWIPSDRIFHLVSYTDGTQIFIYTDSQVEGCTKEHNYSIGAGWAFVMDHHWKVALERKNFLKEIGYRARYIEAVWNSAVKQWVFPWDYHHMPGEANSDRNLFA